MRFKTILMLLAAGLAFAVRAVPTSVEQAVRAVDNWLVGNAALDCGLGASAAEARTLETASGARFHVVLLRDGGFVVVSGDTAIEPIIAFSESKDLVESADNPLYRLLNDDLSGRPVKTLKFASAPGASSRVLSSEEAKWAMLLGDEETDPSAPRKVLKAASGKTSVSDCRVAPLLATQWSQSGPKNLVGETDLCYNYYTPYNYPCGCVATACAQIMYYHRQPATDYNWAAMVEKPANGISEDGAKAIGLLTFDIGYICGAEYSPGGTALGGYMIAPLLTDVYGYGSAIAFQSTSAMSADTFKAAILPNLDAKLPVAVGLHDGGGLGHEVVVDGYGYDYSTLYLHVNMGWAGLDDAWYAPPAMAEFTAIDGIVCNIDPAGSSGKTLVSGRVFDAKTDAPVADVEVSAGSVKAKTDAKGIYALALPVGDQTIVAASGQDSASVKISVKANVGTRVIFSTGRFTLAPMTIANQYGVDLKLDAGGADPADPSSPGADPQQEPKPEPAPAAIVDLVAPTVPFAAPAAVTMSGAVLSADGQSVAGVVQLKVGKEKKGESKVSLTLIGKDGRKYAAKAVNVPVGAGLREVTFDVKGYGPLTLTLGADGFIGRTDGVLVAAVDDEPPTGPAAVELGLDEKLPVEDVLTDYLPKDVKVQRTAKKWTLPKAGKLKYDKKSGELVATGDNIAGLKLTYAPKTQTVKGSFKIWTFDAAKQKLKSVSASVTGVVVGGVAYCDVSVKKQKIGELTVK